jgi:hypothetical protein
MNNCTALVPYVAPAAASAAGSLVPYLASGVASAAGQSLPYVAMAAMSALALAPSISNGLVPSATSAATGLVPFVQPAVSAVESAATAAAAAGGVSVPTALAAGAAGAAGLAAGGYALHRALSTEPKYSTPADDKARLGRAVKWGSGTLKPEILDRYMTLRDHVLSQVVDQGLLEKREMGRVEHFSIDFDEQMITLTLPNSNQKVCVALEELPSEANELLQQLRSDLKVKGANYSGVKVVANKSQRNEGGVKGLDRSADSLKGLASDFAKASQELLPKHLKYLPPQEQKTAVRRHQFVEFYLQKLKEKTQEKMQSKQQELQTLSQAPRTNGAAWRRVGVLQEELKKLNAVMEKLNSVDVYALTLTMSYSPSTPHWSYDLEQRAQHVEKLVRQDLEAKLGSSWFKGKQKLGEAEEAYIQDVVGMMYRKRGDYWKYCKAREIKPKKEGMEDLLLREAIKYTYEGTSSADGFKGSIHFDGLSPELTSEMGTLLEDLSRLADAAIPADTATYPNHPGYPQQTDPKTNQPIPPDEKTKATIDGQCEQAIAQVIDAQRKRVNWTRKDPPPRVVTAARGAATGVLATAPVVSMGSQIGGAALARVGVPPVVAQAVGGLIPGAVSSYFARANPAQAAGAALHAFSMIALGVGYMRGWVSPETARQAFTGLQAVTLGTQAYAMVTNMFPSMATVRQYALPAVATAVALGALGYTGNLPVEQIGQVWDFMRENPGPVVGGALLARGALQATYDCLRPLERRPEMHQFNHERRTRWGRVAGALALGGAAAATAYYVSQGGTLPQVPYLTPVVEAVGNAGISTLAKAGAAAATAAATAYSYRQVGPIVVNVANAAVQRAAFIPETARRGVNALAFTAQQIAQVSSLIFMVMSVFSLLRAFTG